jgi:hypothetical protein
VYDYVCHARYFTQDDSNSKKDSPKNNIILFVMIAYEELRKSLCLRCICDKYNISMGIQDMREFAKEQFDVDI